MEEKLEKKEKEVPAVPDDHPFWERAEKNEFKIGEPLNCEIKKHKFIQSVGLEARCQICNVGYNLPVEGQVRDGHIFIKEELVI